MLIFLDIDIHGPERGGRVAPASRATTLPWGPRERLASEPSHQNEHDEDQEDEPEPAGHLEAMQRRELPDGWDADIPTFDADPKGTATRKASNKVENAVAAKVPWFLPGAADLTGSNAVIEGNFFDGNGRTPTSTDMFLLVCHGARDNLIAGNRFDYSGGKSLIHITASCGGGSPKKLIIRNNALSRFGNKPQAICAGINFGGQRGTLAGDSSVVENNTIYDNGGGCYGLLDTNGSTLTVRNNIFSRITGHRYAIGCNMATGTSKGIAENSLMFGNTQDVESACWTLTGTITEDPRFVDPDASPPDLRRRALRPGAN